MPRAATATSAGILLAIAAVLTILGVGDAAGALPDWQAFILGIVPHPEERQHDGDEQSRAGEGPDGYAAHGSILRTVSAGSAVTRSSRNLQHSFVDPP